LFVDGVRAQPRTKQNRSVQHAARSLISRTQNLTIAYDAGMYLT
jgi:hypothetical protein